MAMPYRPARALHEQMAMTMMMVGTAVPIMPTPRPWMTTVAGPVLPDLVMFWVGVSVYEVEYSVKAPMRMPDARPMRMQPKSLPATPASSKRTKQHAAATAVTSRPAKWMPRLIDLSNLTSTMLLAF